MATVPGPAPGSGGRIGFVWAYMKGPGNGSGNGSGVKFVSYGVIQRIQAEGSRQRSGGQIGFVWAYMKGSGNGFGNGPGNGPGAKVVLYGLI